MGRSSSKREEIYAFLKDYIASHGYPPTTREIMAGVGLRSTASVHYHLSELSRSGAIEMDGGKNRAISLGAEAAPQGVPLIGVVTAGQPILAVENIEGYVPWEAEAGCFALRVRGDSMIEAGIFDGDKVVVRPQQTAENGEIGSVSELLLGLLRIRALEILHYNILLLILILCHLKILQKYC